MVSPIPKLKADLESGEGDVVLPTGWAALPALMRADLLKDWLPILQQEYGKALHEFGKELTIAAQRPRP